MQNNINFRLISLKSIIILLIILGGSIHINAQGVENKKCPDSYTRNNGNGQYNTVFAPNISPNSVYFLQALTSGSQGNFTFLWDSNITNPPVVNKTWITPTNGTTALNWAFGNNSTGSPFNPPGVPEGNKVRYTFYNSNLPNAGIISFELLDPYDGKAYAICSYPLSNGANSTGTYVQLAVNAPSQLTYSKPTIKKNSGFAGNSVTPSVNNGGGAINYSLSQTVPNISIDPSTGIISWNELAIAGTYNFTVTASNGLLPDATTSFTLTLNGIPVVDDITGNINLAPGAFTQLSNTTSNGVWSSSNQLVAIVDQNGLVSAIDNGNVTISYTVSNAYGSTSKSTELIISGAGVGSGIDGGLESKSLGNAIAEREFFNIKNDNNISINYANTELLIPRSNRNTMGMVLKDLLPDHEALGEGFVGYITSPTDILSYTDAIEVAAADYVNDGVNKAVAFSTKTENKVYTHTKPVCDRLKGAELLTIDTVNYNQFKFLRYSLKQSTGIIEYAVSFSVGLNLNSDHFDLQSEWMTVSYTQNDTLFNFQLWSSEISLLDAMMHNVLQKIASVLPLQQNDQVDIPQTYFTKADRNAGNQLNVEAIIRNHTAFTNCKIEIRGKENEQSLSPITYTIDLNIAAFDDTKVILPLNDMAEAEISLLINNKLEDFLYNNDGIWNIYATPSTTVKTFVITNDELDPLATDFRLFRNIDLEATSSDYVTVYKMLKAGGMPVNLSDYKYLKFTGKGNVNVRIRLIKKSIVNYDNQYQYLLPLNILEDGDYVVDLLDFSSAAFNEPINLKDIVMISFTYETTGVISDISSSIKNVNFAELYPVKALTVNKILIHPNPVVGQFNYSFLADQADQFHIEVIELSGGKTVYSADISATEGQNTFTMDLSYYLSEGLYLMRLKSNQQLFVSKFILMNK